MALVRLGADLAVARKRRKQSLRAWALRLDVSVPTLMKLERGDPSVAMATYVSCLWQLNPALDLTRLLAPAATQAKTPALAPACRMEPPSLDRKRNAVPKKAKPAAEPVIKTVNHDEQQAQIERNFAAAKAALDFFKSPLF